MEYELETISSELRVNAVRPRQRLWAIVAIAATALLVAAIGLITAAPAQANGWQRDYVALGDSYTAGTFIPTQIAEDTPPGCAQSDNNYPHLVTKWIRIYELTDVSCSGATTEDMTNPQPTAAGTNPPQFDALDRNTRVVTVGIGGNDIGFGSIVASCLTATPTGQPCQDRYVVDGVDQLRARIDATAPKIDAVIEGIRDRAPRARIHVVGYPDILPISGPGCFPQMPIAPNDVPYLNGIEIALNRMLAREARQNGANFIDTYLITIGHDACQTPERRWIEPISPASPAAPVHPNAKGQQAMAAAAFLGVLLW